MNAKPISITLNGSEIHLKSNSLKRLIESLNLFARGLINPVISKTSNFEGAETLHKEIENGQIIGRAGLIF